nr:caskin-1-like [Lytechinus pictus]
MIEGDEKVIGDRNGDGKSVSSKKSPLNFQDDVGFSALHHAALNGNCGILGTLLDNHHHIIVDLKDNKGERRLAWKWEMGVIKAVWERSMASFGSIHTDIFTPMGILLV